MPRGRAGAKSVERVLCRKRARAGYAHLSLLDLRSAKLLADMTTPLSLTEIHAAARSLSGVIVTTPVHRLIGSEIANSLGSSTEVLLKLELFQATGTFKARGALLNVLGLTPAQRERGVTAISAGNHAIAVAFAAAQVGVSAKVVMISTANALRVALCKSYGAEIVFAPDAHAGFTLVDRLAQEEGRTLIHPFEGRTTALGTATLGLELCEQIPGLEAVIIPIGGGGLCAGVASAVKLLAPGCEVYGVEPEGADSMHRSFAAGQPQGIERVATIADSLGAPYALPFSFDLCRRHVTELVRVSDDELRAAMRFLLRNAKLAVEPAGAAATAALLGPLRARVPGTRAAVIVCGSNIDEATYARLIAA
jgi:threonine dehydratase